MGTDRNFKDTHWTRESDHYSTNGVGNGIGCTYYAWRVGKKDGEALKKVFVGRREVGELAKQAMGFFFLSWE